ncbi:MAG: hypothetical protein ACE5GY_01590 [Thermodesulfobacteriota bacterium]
MMKFPHKCLALPLFGLLLLVAAPCTGAQGRVELGGYYKNLLTASTAASGRGFTGDLNRLRVEIDARAAEGLRAYAAFDSEAVLGSVLDTAEFRAAKRSRAANLFDLSATTLDRDAVFWRQSVYRAYLAYEHGPATVTAGRQRVALGTGRIWNPEDLLNPISPLQIERDERTGTDAVQVEVATGPLSAATFVYAPGRGPGSESFLVRGRLNRSGYDLSGLIGSFKRDRVIGIDFSGYVMDSGLRGELAYTLPDAGDGFLRAVVSFDHTFPSTLYFLAEYLYNGGNDEDLANPAAAVSASSAEILTKNRNFVGLGAAYDLTPLVRLEGLAVLDIDGASAFLGPSLRYNILENLDLTAGVQVFTGRDGGEYGDASDVYYGQLQLYF